MADISKITLPSNDEYNIKDATARSGLATKKDILVSGTNIKTINNKSLLGSGNITIQGGGDSLPDQTGHSGDILTTNGTAASWMDVSEASSVSIDTSISSSSTDSTIPSSKAVWDALSNVDALPDQAGHSGDFLTTNGTTASWTDLSEKIYFCRSNTTLTEATTAVNAGKMLIYYDSTADIYAPMIRAWLQMVQFSAIEPNDPHKLHIFTLNSSGWSTETVDVEEIFIAIYNTTSYADIDAAVTAGKLVVARNGNLSALLVEKNSNTGTYYFRGVGTGSDNIITRFQIASNSTWASTDTTLVTTSRKINNKALSSDITLTASDIGALPDSITIPSPADATPLVDGTATVGTSTDYAREDHVHPTDTSRAPTSHASSATTYGTGTSSNYGHVKLSDSTSSTSGTSDGIAATPSAVRTAYNLANQKVNQTASAGGGDAHSLIDNTYSYIRLGVHVEQDDEHNTLELTSTTTTIHNVVTPTANGDAANKQYVDNAVAGSGLPSQTGNSGKYLTTNGTTASWGAASATSTKSIDSSPTSASSNLVTSGGVYTAINNKVNRTTAVNAADTNYTTLMARGVKLMDATSYDAVSDWSTYLVNGSIAWRYE